MPAIYERRLLKVTSWVNFTVDHHVFCFWFLFLYCIWVQWTILWRKRNPIPFCVFGGICTVVSYKQRKMCQNVWVWYLRWNFNPFPSFQYTSLSLHYYRFVSLIVDLSFYTFRTNRVIKQDYTQIIEFLYAIL